MTEEQAFKILQRIAAAFARFELNEDRVDVWQEYLRKMPYKPVLQNVNNHIKEKKFPPTIAEIAAQTRNRNDYLEKVKEWEANAKNRSN